MARILVKLVSAVSLDSAKNAMLYKRGDVVKVVEDGYFFGKKIEGNKNPKFGIIDISGVSAATYSSLIEPRTEELIGGDKGDVDIVLRRMRQVDVDSMTVGELADLEGSEKKVTMTEARLNSLVEVKP